MSANNERKEGEPLKGIRLFFLSVLAGAVVLIGGVVPAQAATIIVRPGQSIQAAVDAASPGDTIQVLTGAYRESVVITTPGIALRGVSSPAIIPPGGPSACGFVGICVLGDVDLGTGEVFTYVRNVTVSGFIFRGFEEAGVAVFGGDGTTIQGNQSLQSAPFLLGGEYGIAAFMSKNTRVLSNSANGASEAGIYIGDSPRANATVSGNKTQGNFFGIFVRNAQYGSLTGNTAVNNCAGAVFLGDAPGPVGFFNVSSNNLNNNSLACGDFSGIGIALLGTTGMLVRANTILNNRPVGFPFITGGVVVLEGFGSTIATQNQITNNTIRMNSPDIFWDSLGSNLFANNLCHSSIPKGLCTH